MTPTIGGVNLDLRFPRAGTPRSTCADGADHVKARSSQAGAGRTGRSQPPAQREQAGSGAEGAGHPSILVETAFISNPEEEEKLRDRAYQDKMADAIADGIRRYFAKNPALARV
jgi:N-acetylmuramoyl-L-alanine amidase